MEESLVLARVSSPEFMLGSYKPSLSCQMVEDDFLSTCDLHTVLPCPVKWYEARKSSTRSGPRLDSCDPNPRALFCLHLAGTYYLKSQRSNHMRVPTPLPTCIKQRAGALRAFFILFLSRLGWSWSSLDMFQKQISHPQGSQISAPATNQWIALKPPLTIIINHPLWAIIDHDGPTLSSLPFTYHYLWFNTPLNHMNNTKKSWSWFTNGCRYWPSTMGWQKDGKGFKCQPFLTTTHLWSTIYILPKWLWHFAKPWPTDQPTRNLPSFLWLALGSTGCRSM